jgi:hypothetical protein
MTHRKAVDWSVSKADARLLGKRASPVRPGTTTVDRTTPWALVMALMLHCYAWEERNAQKIGGSYGFGCA